MGAEGDERLFAYKHGAEAEVAIVPPGVRDGIRGRGGAENGVQGQVLAITHLHPVHARPVVQGLPWQNVVAKRISQAQHVVGPEGGLGRPRGSFGSAPGVGPVDVVAFEIEAEILAQTAPCNTGEHALRIG